MNTVELQNKRYKEIILYDDCPPYIDLINLWELDEDVYLEILRIKKYLYMLINNPEL